MYSLSGIAISSGSLRSLPALDFQAEASFVSVEDFAAFIGSMSAFGEGFLRGVLAALPSAGEETLGVALARALGAGASASAAEAVLGASVLAWVLVTVGLLAGVRSEGCYTRTEQQWIVVPRGTSGRRSRPDPCKKAGRL